MANDRDWVDVAEGGKTDGHWEDVMQGQIPNTPHQVATNPSMTPSTAYQPKLQSVPFPSPYPVPGGAPNISPYSKGEQEAAQEGVDIDTGAPASVQAKVSLAPDIEYQKDALGKLLGTQTRMGPKSGQLEFLDKDSQKWTTLKGSNAIRKMASMAGGSIDATGQIVGAGAGAVGGAAAGGGFGAFAGSVIGSGVGGAAGRLVRIKAGQAAGVLPDTYPTGSDITDEGFKSAAYDLGAQGILGGLKYARYWYKGSRAFSPVEASLLGDTAAKYDDLINEVSRRAGTEFNPTLGQRVSGDKATMKTKLGKQTLGYDAALSQKNSPTVHDMEALQQGNEDTLANFLGSANDAAIRPEDLTGPMNQTGRQQAGEDVGAGITDMYNGMLEQARKLVTALPESLPASEKGKVMRDTLVAADKWAKDNVETPAWSKYREATGYNPATFSSDIKVPWNDDVRALMSSWDERNKSAIIKAIQNDNSGLKLLFKDNEDVVSPLLGSDGLPIKLGVKDNQSVDLAVLDDTIRWIRSDARKALKNKTGVSYDERDLVSLERELSGMRDGYLKESKPETFQLLQEAEAATKQRAATFKQGVLGDLLVKDGPDSFRLTDADAIYRILNSKDDSAAQAFSKIAKGSPEAMQAARQMIFAMYRRDVTDATTKVPSAKGHAEFMQQYGQVVKQFFNPADYATLDRLGGMGTVIADTEKKLRVILPGLQKVVGGEVEAMNASTLATRTLGAGFTQEKVKAASRLIKSLGDDGQGLLAEWQGATLDALSQKLVKNGQINLSELNKITVGDGGNTIKALLDSGPNPKGTSYINDLKTLQEAANMIRAKGKGTMEDQGSPLAVRFMRLFFGQFSPEARVITFGQKSRSRQNPGELFNAISDPQKIHDLSKQAKVMMGQVQAANIAAAAAANGGVYDNY